MGGRALALSLRVIHCTVASRLPNRHLSLRGTRTWRCHSDGQAISHDAGGDCFAAKEQRLAMTEYSAPPRTNAPVPCASVCHWDRFCAAQVPVPGTVQVHRCAPSVTPQNAPVDGGCEQNWQCPPSIPPVTPTGDGRTHGGEEERARVRALLPLPASGRGLG